MKTMIRELKRSLESFCNHNTTTPQQAKRIFMAAHENRSNVFGVLGGVLVFGMLVALPHRVVLADDKPFSDQEAKELSARLQKESVAAEEVAKFNQSVDLCFKIGLLLLAVSATFGAGAVAVYKQGKPPAWLTWSNLATTALATALSTFAYGQLNFEQRNTVWQAKADALSNLSVTLEYSNPKREDFLKTMAIVRKWHDHTPLSALNLDWQTQPSPPSARSPQPNNP
jgi:hypothetical protein